MRVTRHGHILGVEKEELKGFADEKDHVRDTEEQ